MLIQTERMSLLTTESTLCGSHRKTDAETHVAGGVLSIVLRGSGLSVGALAERLLHDCILHFRSSPG